MAKTITEERLRWVLPIAQKEIRLAAAAKVCPYSKRSLERWLKAYKAGGQLALEPCSTRPKTSPRETPMAVKEAVRALRKRQGVCALKLHWKLAKQGIHIHERTIGKILKAEGLVRKYRMKRVKYPYVKVEMRPGELVEIDVKYVPGRVAGKQYFQYTAIDSATRWRHMKIFDGESTFHAIVFLQEVMARFPYATLAVKTDNHSTFTNYYTGTNKRSDLTVKTVHAFDVFCREHGIVHYLIDPAKPAQNGKVERSHGSDQKTFYERTAFASLEDLRRKVRRWNTEYNDLEHCGLDGLTPNEALTSYQLSSPPNVCA